MHREKMSQKDDQRQKETIGAYILLNGSPLLGLPNSVKYIVRELSFIAVNVCLHSPKGEGGGHRSRRMQEQSLWAHKPECICLVLPRCKARQQMATRYDTGCIQAV